MSIVFAASVKTTRKCRWSQATSSPEREELGDRYHRSGPCIGYTWTLSEDHA